MGIIKRGILGGFQNKVANVVGSSWKGIAVMRALPVSVANPRTAPQVAQRNKFKFSGFVASKLLTSIIKPLWDRFAVQMSGYNHFMSINAGKLIDFATTNWMEIVFSSGKMAQTIGTIDDADAGANTVDLAWNDDSGEGYKLATDKLYVTLVNKSGEKIEGFSAVAIRSAGLGQIHSDLGFVAGNVLYVSFSFLREDGTVVSNSNVQTVVVA